MKASSEIDNWIIEAVNHVSHKITASDLEKMMIQLLGLERKAARSILRRMIDEGELEYTNIYGRTFLEVSFSRPVPLSDHIVVKPPDITFEANQYPVVINIGKGIAFGRGTHTTTRLCVEAIDVHLTSIIHDRLYRMKAIDVGTGSGILAMAAAKMGISHVWACDTDPIAVNEAGENVRMNDLENRVTIETSINTSVTYDLIIANLRYPTLIDLQPLFMDISGKQSLFILSGLKTSELKYVEQKYMEKKLLKKIWCKSAGDWCAVVFQKMIIENCNS